MKRYGTLLTLTVTPFLASCSSSGNSDAGCGHLLSIENTYDRIAGQAKNSTAGKTEIARELANLVDTIQSSLDVSTPGSSVDQALGTLKQDALATLHVVRAVDVSSAGDLANAVDRDITRLDRLCTS